MGGPDSERPHTICADDSGYVYLSSGYVNTTTLCGTSQPAVVQQTASGNQTENICISKLSSAGNCIWNILGVSKVNMNNATLQTTNITDIKYYNGFLYLTGMFCDSLIFPNCRLGAGPAQDIVPFVLKVSAAGVVQWGKTFRSPTARAVAVAVNTGGIFVAGTYEDSVSFGNIKITHPQLYSFLVRIDHNGNYVWAKNVDNDFYNQVDDLCFDGNNSLYLTGIYADTTFYTSTYIEKMNLLGTTLWRHAGPTKIGGSMRYHRLAWSGAGSGAIYLTAMFTDSARWATTTYTSPAYVYKDMLVKIDPSGQLLWSRSVGHKNFLFAFTGIVETNNRGAILYTSFTDSMVIGTQTYVSAGNLDDALIQYDHSGNILWKLVFGGTGQEQPWDVHCRNGAVYLACRNMSSYNIGPLSVVNAGYGDILAVKFFDELASSLPDQPPGSTTAIYPVPANDILYISSAEPVLSVILTDLQGRHIKQFENTEQFNVSDLAEGLYLVQVFSSNQQSRIKIAVQH